MQKEKTSEPESETRPFMTTEDARITDAIQSSKAYSDEEVDKIILGFENHDNLFEFLKTMNEFQLPEALQKMQDSGEQYFRWVDTSDPQTFDIQLNRQQFRWTPVNRMSHGNHLEKRFFNKNGGVMRGTSLLCWMPGKLHRAWMAFKHRLANAQWQQTSEKYSQKRSGIEFYDPSREGRSGILRTDPGFIHEADDKHPEDIFMESGEYESGEADQE
jgi:hypothetical protein